MAAFNFADEVEAFTFFEKVKTRETAQGSTIDVEVSPVTSASKLIISLFVFW